MRTFILTTGLFILLLGCSKKNDPARLTGTWREMSTSGGLGGGTTRFDNELRLLRLNEDSTWTLSISDTLTTSGVYSLSTITHDSVSFYQQIIFQHNDGRIYPRSQLVQFTGGQLLLSDNDITEGYTSVYRRFWP